MTTVAPPRTHAGRWDLAQLYFNGTGRIGRLPFLAALFTVGAAWRLWRATPERWPHLVFGPLVGLLLIAAACTLMSKRLHDVGLAGWWAAGPLALTLLGADGDAPSSPAELTAGTLAGVLLAALAVWPGLKSFNRFGPPRP